MKTKMNIKSIIFISIICIASLLFINMSFAANTGKIIVDTAKLRENPDTESKVLELASIGEEVEILEEEGEWYKVKYKKITGYIRNDLIQVKNTEENKNQISENEVNEDKVDEQNTVIETNATVSENKEIQKGKYKISEDIKLKIIPLISAIEIKDLKQNEEVEVIEILNDWVQIKTIDETQGWIRKDKLENIKNTEEQPEISQPEVTKAPDEVKQTTMYVNSQSVNMREKSDKTSKVITQFSVNTQVTVIGEEGTWYQVEINGQKGYISKDLLSTTKQETSRSSMNTRSTTNTENKIAKENEKSKEDNSKTEEKKTEQQSGTGSSVVSYAQTLLGCKYVYGGTTTSGFDCSGFTQYVYKHFGVSLNRTAASQYSNGTSVTDLQAGDLVMFGKSGINHVGIYIGGNRFIHAANPSKGVTTDTLSSGYYKTNYVGARRVF